MKIQIGEIALNRTKKYLLPCLKAYGPEFEKRFNSVFKVAVGIGDIVLVDKGVSYEQHLFILLDVTNNAGNKKAGKKFFHSFIDWIREQDMYEEDYAFDSLHNGRLHMVVIKLHPSCYGPLYQFRQSQFSKMYTLSEVEEYFKGKPDVQQILIKDSNYKVDWTEQLNKEFGTSLSPKDIEGELDFTIRREDEFFGPELGRS